MKSESELRRTLVRGLRAHHVMAVSIESGTTGLGIPDVYIRTKRVGAWAELKNVKSTIKYPFTISFRPGQYQWLTTHHRLGGTSLLIVGTLFDIFVFKNEHIKEVYDKTMYKDIDFSFVNFNVAEFIDWLDQ